MPANSLRPRQVRCADKMPHPCRSAQAFVGRPERGAKAPQVPRRGHESRRLAGLTGILNHGHFANRLAQVARTVDGPVALAMIDIDRFKAVNDTWGHAVGARVIRALSNLLASGVGPLDAVGRCGGEEFGVLLPGLAADDAFALIRRGHAPRHGRANDVGGRRQRAVQGQTARSQPGRGQSRRRRAPARACRAALRVARHGLWHNVSVGSASLATIPAHAARVSTSWGPSVSTGRPLRALRYDTFVPPSVAARPSSDRPFDAGAAEVSQQPGASRVRP